MSFWAYMLQCRGGYFYVGHTDDLERRVGEHKSGLIPGFTADHQPVELVWSDEFQTRVEAKAGERKIKGWSRAKKLALIRGDWERISALAKKKDSPSTSSGKSGLGEMVAFQPVCPELVEGLSFSLLPHPQSTASAIRQVGASVLIRDGLLWLNFEVSPIVSLICPAKTDPARTDGLWQSTCFELFVKDREGTAYQEFNFSPSTQWAAYQFDSYREGMRNRAMLTSPGISSANVGEGMILIASLDARILNNASSIALSAVIEELDGTKSYWALNHPPGKPDFHHPSCFTLTLPPPTAP